MTFSPENCKKNTTSYHHPLSASFCNVDAFYLHICKCKWIHLAVKRSCLLHTLQSSIALSNTLYSNIKFIESISK